MQLTLSGHHIDVTPALRDYVNSKMERLSHYSDLITSTHVVLSVEKLAQKAEANLHVTGANLFANAQHEDMYVAIDELMGKLERQLKRHKEKTKDHHQADGGIKAQQPAAEE